MGFGRDGERRGKPRKPKENCNLLSIPIPDTMPKDDPEPDHGKSKNNERTCCILRKNVSSRP